MSHNVVTPAWKTKLGNAPAKTVLVLLADSSNSDGASSWPSLSTIARETELSERQVRRILQIFREIGLVEQLQKPNKYTFQLNLSLLGTDLCKPFNPGTTEYPL